MTSPNDDFNGFYNQYTYTNNNNGDYNFDGQDWFSSFYGDSVCDSQPLTVVDTSASFQPQSHLSHYNDNLGLNVEEAARDRGRVGLKLTKTPSFLSSLNQLNSFTNKKMKKPDPEPDHSSIAAAEKLKAANFHALTLRIGTWMIVSKHEGDLVAKCYFKKKKLVWEVLDGNIKRKVEFQWSNISAIKATFPLNGPAILDIILEKRPMFYEEVDPQPKKHTVWEPSCDFTNNQASLYRRHTLVTSQGVLEKHYETLLKADQRLHELSKQAFPENARLHFNDIQFSNYPSSFDNLTHPHILNRFIPQQHNSVGSTSSVAPFSSGMDFPGYDNNTSNYGNPGYFPAASTYNNVHQQEEYYNVNNQLQQIPPAVDVPYLGYDQMSNDFQDHSFFGGGNSWM